MIVSSRGIKIRNIVMSIMGAGLLLITGYGMGYDTASKNVPTVIKTVTKPTKKKDYPVTLPVSIPRYMVSRGEI